jgi:2-keto-3-deoxy-L-rhamnonate aldolase RhmA
MSMSFKEKLRRGSIVTVVNPDHPSPSLTEFIAGLGFDAIFVDCEHGMATIERVQEMCRAARAAGVQSIVRPDTNADWLITRYFEAGAGGIMVPHIDSAQEARALVEAVRYARYRDYADKVVVAMIESQVALADLPAILAVEGIDVFFVGPGDLSASMGRPGQVSHPDIRALVIETIRRIGAAGKIAGTAVACDSVAEFAASGCRFLYQHANEFTTVGARDFAARLSSIHSSTEVEIGTSA